MPMLVLRCSHPSIVPLFNCVLVQMQGAEQVLRYRGNLPLAMQRSLKQVADPAGAANYEGVRYVTTPQELQAAVADGARHIQITDHLDLTTLEPSMILPNSFLPTILGISKSTLSIQVRSSPVLCQKVGRLCCACMHKTICSSPVAPEICARCNLGCH
jgi:hypothetical protein